MKRTAIFSLKKAICKLGIVDRAFTGLRAICLKECVNYRSTVLSSTKRHKFGRKITV